MQQIFTRLSFFLLLLLSAGAAFAQEQGSGKVRLRTGVVSLEPYAAFVASGGAVADSGLWLVQWSDSGNNRLGAKAEGAAGFRQVGNFPENVSLLYGASDASFLKLHARFPLKGIISFRPEWKAEPAWMQALSGRVEVAVTFPENIPQSRILADLAALGAGDIKPEISPKMMRFQIAATALPRVLLLPYIITVGPASRRVPLNNDERGYSGAAVLSQQISENPLGRNLSGRNVVVGVGDNSAPMTHVDLEEKTTNFHPDPPVNHGTHVCGTVAGSGIIDGAARGMAPRAALISEVYELILQKTPEFRQAYGMTITNNSYAAQVGQCSSVGQYDAYAEAVDNLCRELPDVLHVFAAGNDGGLQCGAFPGFGNVPGSFQPAKNNLVVGNVQKDMLVRYTSSKGPVADGRLKPEICAFGTSVYSTYINNTYAQTTGTSMASPAIAGAAALLTERYKQLKNNQLPKAVLLKGLLTGCADDRGNPGPDYKYGFGMFNLARSVQALEEARFFSQQISPAQPVFSATINIPGGLAEAKILLVWEDEAASPLAAQTLINDLDLTITDPSGNIRKPLVLDPMQPDALAQPGTDRLNNIEQVVIPNAISGNYTIQVSGTSLSGATLNMAVVYDFVEKGIRLLQPTAGVPIAAGKPLNIFWETPESNGPFTLEYSADNGVSWNNIGTATDSQRAFIWAVPMLNTSNVKVRISRGSDMTEAGPLVVNQVPVVTRSSSQCPGYFNVSWTLVPTAIGYEILQKKGLDMVPIDTVYGNNYILGGLPARQMQYLAVRPLINGQAGYRSLAVRQIPDTAKNCGAFAGNDLALQAVVSPTTGRVLTQSAFTGNSQMAVAVRNNGPVAATYQVSYRWGNTARQVTASKTIAANAIDTTLLLPQNLAAVGSYILDAAVLNLSGTDPISGNDSLKTTFRQLPNTPVNLAAGYNADFESAPRLTLTKDSLGLFDGSRWDYNRSDGGYGRLRTFVDTTVLISGNRSISLDADRFFRSSRNFFQGTFNLMGYDVTNTEVRAEFDYMVHGASQYPDSNALFVRGSDSDPWIVFYAFDSSVAKGLRSNSGSLSVSDVLRANGQQLSSSTTVLFVQKDTTVIAASDYGTGYTVDNFRLYTLGNDIALLSIDTPLAAGCGVEQDTRVLILIANGTYNPQYNVPVSYRLDGGPVFTDTIAYFGPKDTLHFTLSQKFQIRDFGKHRFDVWIHYAPDVYLQNDSFLNYTFQRQPLTDTFPYLENFETGKGGWYAEGNNSSWDWGMPQSQNIRTAASGTKAWKTALAGGYNPSEKSYLYSPCFDIGRMAQPRLSFSLAYDFENCGNTLCDAAWVEWSTDSKTWTKLGLSVEGFNWYDSLQHRAWTGSGQYRWRVATIGLPTWASGPIRLRFVMQSDAIENREGIAIDDIHIYDYEGPVYKGPFASVEKVIDATQQTVDFRKDATLLARMQPNGQDLGATLVQDYGRETVVDSFARRLFLPRSFVFQIQNSLKDSLPLALYITDADVLKMLADTGCSGCEKAPDAYRLGVLHYSDTARTNEDGSFANNSDGRYQFRPFQTLTWVPYDSGYIARFQTKQTGEMWFAAGKTAYSYESENRTLAFSATRKTPTTASLKIESRNDAQISRYEMYRSVAGKTAFEKIYETNSRNSQSSVTYIAEDNPPAVAGDTVLYQVQWIGRESGLRFRGSLHRLIWLPEATFALYPNPAPDGHFTLQYSAPIGSELRLQLTDISGRVLYQKAFTNTIFQTSLDLPLNLRAGVYFLSTELEGKKTLEKIVAL